MAKEKLNREPFRTFNGKGTASAVPPKANNDAGFSP